MADDLRDIIRRLLTGPSLREPGQPAPTPPTPVEMTVRLSPPVAEYLRRNPMGAARTVEAAVLSHVRRLMAMEEPALRGDSCPACGATVDGQVGPWEPMWVERTLAEAAWVEDIMMRHRFGLPME